MLSPLVNSFHRLAAVDPLAPALVLASAVHLLLIFGLGFSWPASLPEFTSRAVTVALTASHRQPIDATHIASVDQLGDADPAEMTAAISGAVFSISDEEGLAEESTLTAGELAAQMEALQREVAALSDMRSASNPRLGAVAARRALDADYLLRWRDRVEILGNVLYRRIAAQGHSGDVRLAVTVRSDGALMKVSLLRSSGHLQLDAAAIDTVRRAAPFPAFPPALRAQTDRLEIIRTWQFRQQEGDT